MVTESLLAEADGGKPAEKALQFLLAAPKRVADGGRLVLRPSLLLCPQVLSSGAASHILSKKKKKATSEMWQSTFLGLILISKLLLSIHIILSSNTYFLKL